MRATLTISLPGKLRQQMVRASKCGHLTQSEFVRKAVLDKLWEDAIDESRRMLAPGARAMGVYTDVIVIGDKDLLVLKCHEGIGILTPRQFLELHA